MFKRSLRCSFCGKNETQVTKLVAGSKAYICDECVAIASRIMENTPGDNQGPPAERVSWWRALVSRIARGMRGTRVLRTATEPR